MPFFVSTEMFSEYNVPFGLKYFCGTGQSLGSLCHSSSMHCKAAFSRHLGTPHWLAAQSAKLGPEARAEKSLTQWLWATEHPFANPAGEINSETAEDTPDGSVSCTRSSDAPKSPVSVISRLLQWEILPQLHCLQSLPVIPLLHSNRPAWLHEEPEFENTAREALSFSLINSLLPKIEEEWV